MTPAIAFSSEVETGSREENALMQKKRAHPDPISSDRDEFSGKRTKKLGSGTAAGV
jgi:hypothetical protein